MTRIFVAIEACVVKLPPDGPGVPSFGGHSIVGHVMLMRRCSLPRSKPASPPEFKVEPVRLVGSSDRSLSRLAEDPGVADQTLRTWVRRAEIDGGERDGLAPNEREELRHRRREVRTLPQGREILKQAAACFAEERDATR